MTKATKKKLANRRSLYMRLNKVAKKSRAVLKALAQGHSCGQILAADRSLTSHDIFHALSEAPTKFWAKKPNPKREPGRSLS